MLACNLGLSFFFSLKNYKFFETNLLQDSKKIKLNHQKVAVLVPRYFLKIEAVPTVLCFFQASTGTAVLLESTVPLPYFCLSFTFICTSNNINTSGSWECHLKLHKPLLFLFCLTKAYDINSIAYFNFFWQRILRCMPLQYWRKWFWFGRLHHISCENTEHMFFTKQLSRISCPNSPWNLYHSTSIAKSKINQIASSLHLLGNPCSH